MGGQYFGKLGDIHGVLFEEVQPQQLVIVEPYSGCFALKLPPIRYLVLQIQDILILVQVCWKDNTQLTRETGKENVEIELTMAWAKFLPIGGHESCLSAVVWLVTGVVSIRGG